MMEVDLELLSFLLQIISVANIAAGIPGSLTLWRTGNTEGWPTLFFIIGLCGAAGMLVYGVFLDNFTVKLSAGLGVLANIYYIITFLLVSTKKRTELGYLAVAATYLACLAGVSLLYYNNNQVDQMLNVIGSVSTAVFFLMNASTVLDVIDVVQKKVISFDLVMLFFGLANSTLWILYGYLLRDMFLYAPNLPFVVTGMLKILLLTVYPMTSKKSLKSE